jgi:hypothetical protein
VQAFSCICDGRGAHGPVDGSGLERALYVGIGEVVAFEEEGRVH